jgi:hypothetical protein
MYKIVQFTRSPRLVSVHRSKNLRLATYCPRHTNRNVICKALDTNEALIIGTYYVGKSITLFTMFFCSLNYLYYRSLREEEDKPQDDNKKKQNTKK